MKYCVDFIKANESILNEVDEINYTYDIKNIPQLERIIKDYNFKRINIILAVVDKEKINQSIETIRILKEKNNINNIYVQLFYFSEEIREEINKLKEYNIPFYFFSKVNDWETFTGLINLGISDIFISGDLGFSLPQVASRAHKNNIQIRAIPNYCNKIYKNTSALQTFFIRPEDIDVYESYIDILEFYGEAEKQKILYEIYKDEQWYGKLKEIILNFDNDLDSRFIIPNFGEVRTKCERKCLKNEKCQICQRIESLSKNLEKSKLMIKKDKKKESEDNG